MCAVALSRETAKNNDVRSRKIVAHLRVFLLAGMIEVHSPHKLESQVLHKYFRHSKFASFQRQLNYFGFRKLAGKGKMAPCSYVNEAASGDIGSLLLIKVSLLAVFRPTDTLVVVFSLFVSNYDMFRSEKRAHRRVPKTRRARRRTPPAQDKPPRLKDGNSSNRPSIQSLQVYCTGHQRNRHQGQRGRSESLDLNETWPRVQWGRAYGIAF